MAEVPYRFLAIDLLAESGKGFRVGVAGERRVAAGVFYDQLSRRLDGVIVKSADIVDFAGSESLRNVRQGARCICHVGRRAMMSAINGEGAIVKRAVAEEADDRPIR